MTRAAICWLLLGAAAGAAEIRIIPPEIALHGPHSLQRVVVTAVENNVSVGDRTRDAKFISSNPQVAKVNSDGVVRPAGDGTATISATVGDVTTSAQVIVKDFANNAPPDFDRDVEPVFTRIGCNSGSCHGALAGKGGLKLSLRGYAPSADWFALSRQALGRRVDLDRPDDSLMLLKPTRSLPHGGGKRFAKDSEEYRRLRAWIAAGAPAADHKRPALVALDVFPAHAQLKVKDEFQVLVQARYADGAVEDVTKWARFASSGESVASVDEFGTVGVAGAGEAAINVSFGTHVAAAIITVPYDRPVPDLKGIARNNFIDDYILRKLEELHIPPSPPCDDRTFIRRAFLDTLGTLPTPDEVDRFVADSTADKRAKLAEALLRRPEYADYWTYKWCDVLLLSTRKLGQPELWAFYRFVRSAVAENRPWDRFAREVLTARGSTLDNGAGNYFVMHKDPAELVEATAITFLGTSITCARCHNHPLEKWTQDQYWAFANMFGRVALKGGDHGGEVVVVDEPNGDVPHLRRGIPMPPAPLGAPSILANADRRAKLAEWLTRADNPFFAKAAVNRVWKNFFGRGLVEAEDDMRQTNPPTHPELLNELARRFVQNGYDMKWLMRTILNSAAYQRSAKPMAGNENDDRFLSRYIVRRLPAEVILDAYSQITGVPTNFNEIYTTNMVPTKSDLYPAGIRALQLPDALVVSRFLESFGRPPREQACSCERQHESSMTQTLHLANGSTLNGKLRAKASIAGQWVDRKLTDANAVREAFRLGFGRGPTADEEARMAKQLRAYGDERRAAFEDLIWAVGTNREFLFNH